MGRFRSNTQQQFVFLSLIPEVLEIFDNKQQAFVCPNEPAGPGIFSLSHVSHYVYAAFVTLGKANWDLSMQLLKIQ